jgi:uncharacterized protein (TIGR03435 family)
LICQNITMTQFAELLRGRTPDLQMPVGDATGIEGGWDFRLTCNPVAALALRAAVDSAAPTSANPAPISAAPEPIAGIFIFDAIDKQLG